MQTRLPSIIRLAFLSAALVLPPAALAADKEVEELRTRLLQLSDNYEKQERTIRLLEARLAEMEMGQRGRGLPQGTTLAQAGQPGSTAADGTPGSTPADGPVVKEAPRSRTTETVVQEQHALFDRKFTLETGLTYTRYDRRQLVLSGFLALDAIFLGSIDLQQTKANQWTFDVTGRYGLSDRFSTDFNVPLVYRNNTYIEGGAGGGGATNFSDYQLSKGPGLGDISVGGYYQFFKETSSWPDIVGSLRIKAPTGEHPYGIKLFNPTNNNNFAVPKDLPTGNGVWTSSIGLSFLKTTDPAVLFANIGYNYNFKRSFSDISSTLGVRTPGEIKLGDSFQWGAGLALALNERTSLSLSFAQLISRASRTKQQGAGWQRAIGSEANSAVFNVGLTHTLSDKLSVIGNVGVGLTPDAPDFSVGIKLPYTF
jgi:hypothetical protein